MSFDSLKKIVGQSSVVIIDLYLDENDPAIESWIIDPQYSVSYNTPKTTTQPGAYNPLTPKKLYRFSNQQLGPAAGVHFPILRSQSITPPVLKDGIALFTGLNFTLADIVTNDFYELPEEFADRRITGSFIAKLFARNYMHNRTAIYRQGFDPGNFDLNNFQSQTFVVDKVQGPSYNGIATFACLDPLVWTEESKAKAPKKSNGDLTADITNADTTLILTGTIEPEEYGIVGATGYIFIDSEVLGFTVTSDTPPTVGMNVSRAEWGTTANDHKAAALAQNCFFAIDENVTDIILKLFDQTNITQDMINLDQFADAKATTLALHNYTGIITAPNGVGSTITDLLTLAQSQIFFDTVEANVSFIHISEIASPSFSIDALLDIKPGTLTTKYQEDKQITRQAINWARLDSSNTDIENFSNGFMFIDGLKEAPGVYGEASEGEEITTIWIDASNTNIQLATSIAQKIVTKAAIMPVMVSFDVDIQHISSIGDGIWLGEYIEITNAPLWTGPDLIPENLNIQITSMKPKDDTTYSITGTRYNQTVEDVDHVIDGNYENLLLTDIAPPIPGKQTIVFILSTTTIGSIDTANPALITGLYPDGLLIRNRGKILAMGGNASDGSNGAPPLPGSPGGNALEIQTPNTVIDNGNGGLIWAGGGGGSGSESALQEAPLPVVVSYGSGGGGGASYLPTTGGIGINTGAPGFPGADGEPGGINGPGAGGQFRDDINVNNPGGNGGDWGENGGSYLTSPGGLGGLSVFSTGTGSFTIIGGENEFQLRPIPI